MVIKIVVQRKRRQLRDYCRSSDAYFWENLSVAQRMAANGRGQVDLSVYFTRRLRGRRRGVPLLFRNAVYNLPAGGAMALELAIISIVAGVVLGLRYRVLILVPAIMFATMFAVIVGLAHADSMWSILLMTMVLGAALQVGYLAGLIIRAIIDWVRALLVRHRGPGLSSLGLSPQIWQVNGWVPSAAARLRQPTHPQG